MLALNDKSKILVIAPHPDDETIGCGGLISLYHDIIDLLIVTDGRKGHATNISDEECIIQRRNEVKNVFNYSLINKISFLGIEDLHVFKSYSFFKNVNFSQYDYVFIPNRYERHPDHVYTNLYVRKILKKKKYKKVIVEYEVWTPLTFPNCFIDISKFIERKKEMMSKYISQLTEYDYVDICESLSRYRGAINSTMYAEAFYQYRYYSLYEKLKRFVRNKFHNLKVFIKKVGKKC